MVTASRESRPGSVRASSGVLAVNPSSEVESTMSASAEGPASASRSRIGTPVHTALPTRSPPTGLDTHASVTIRSRSGRAVRSSKRSVSSRSTMPWRRSSHASTSMRGTDRAVSMR